ncbi:MAG: hypothetical protein C4308_12295 [Chitinophagaceae bacterium]
MKKWVFLACALLLFTVGPYAQKKITYGASAGVTFASQTTKIEKEKVDKSDTRTGFTVGVFLDYMYNKIFSFQPGISFVQKGAKGEAGGYGYENTLNYVELPLNFIARVKAGKKHKFLFGAGPWFAMGLSGKSKLTKNGSSKTSDIYFGTDNSKNDYRKFDLGGNVLGGIQLANGFFLSGNLNFGLNNINFKDNKKLINNYYGIKIGYLIPRK